MSEERRGTSVTRRTALAGAGLAGVATVVGVSACSRKDPTWVSQDAAGDPSSVGATITAPAADAVDVEAATEIAYTLVNTSTATVELKSAEGTIVTGAPRADGSTWVPATTLDYATTYTVTVTAVASDGRTAATTSTFTTMAKPSKVNSASSFTGDNAIVGVAMPLMVRFTKSVPQARRAEVQKRLFIDATPVQDGIWHWFSGTEVHFRPKDYWQPGSKINVRVAIGGLDMGNGYFGRTDITIDNLTIGPSMVLVADNATKKLTASKDGRVVRTMPISLGKPSTPSSSGHTVIIEKFVHTIFDTYAELGPELGYRTPIDYAQRLTWSGEYIHSAPWSVKSQGHRNVSHGCVNVSPANAKWLFDNTLVGTPVITKGTEQKLKDGNGWTHWNMTWDKYVAGSALPYTPLAAVSPTPTPAA